MLKNIRRPIKKPRLIKSSKIRFAVWSAIVLALLLFSILGPVLAPHDPYAMDLSNTNMPPSAEYPFGTDYIGRCIMSRLFYGAFRSIFASVLVVLITFVIGTAIGVISGFLGGKFDIIVQRFVDSIQAFPYMIFTIAVAALLGNGIVNCIIALSVVTWPRYTRLARAQVISIKERTFISAARVSGTPKLLILVTNIFPNILPALVVEASMRIGTTILSFSTLSFIGLGTAPPYPEWGNMLDTARQYFQTAPWTFLFPGLAILIVVLIMSMFGDSINSLLHKSQIDNDN